MKEHRGLQRGTNEVHGLMHDKLCLLLTFLFYLYIEQNRRRNLHVHMWLPYNIVTINDGQITLRKATPEQDNSREERKALRELREDKSRRKLTADNGVGMVMFDKKDYTQKS